MPKTRYELFCDKWSKGCGNSICSEADNVVQFRGKIPCELLFIGEAPGEVENCIGVPFCGPAGHLLDDIISRSGAENYRYGITNTLGCLPKADDSRKGSEPLPDELEACRGRLVDLIAMCKPTLIVCVGTVSRDWFDPKLRRNLYHHGKDDEVEQWIRDIPTISIDHPAYILRMNVAMRGLAVQKAIVRVQSVIQRYLVKESCEQNLLDIV